MEARIGWNAFHLGFASITYFNSWKDLEYGVQIYTPMTSFKHSRAVLKILLEPDRKIITSRIVIHNFTKAWNFSSRTYPVVQTHFYRRLKLQVGVHFEYDSEKSQIMYLDECDNFYDKDTPGIYKSKVLHNGLLELDTLIYPTVMGKYHLRQSDNRYTVDAKVVVFFLKVDVTDQLEYEVLNRWLF